MRGKGLQLDLDKKYEKKNVLMILGGILRSGGKTTVVMFIDMIGTWIFGVPLGLLTAFVFHLPIAAVYFVLSMEECIRVIISLVIFRKKKWMQTL